MSVLADQPRLDHRVALDDVVPIDYLAWLRRTTLTIFCVYAVIWTRDNGILWDRLGIARAVAVWFYTAPRTIHLDMTEDGRRKAG